MNVINDGAEVQLSVHYLEAACTKEHYQNVLQVVKSSRKEINNLLQKKCGK